MKTLTAEHVFGCLRGVLNIVGDIDPPPANTEGGEVLR
jgi:hypothetical protein